MQTICMLVVAAAAAVVGFAALCEAEGSGF
jgi:hypothetical protein